MTSNARNVIYGKRLWAQMHARPSALSAIPYTHWSDLEFRVYQVGPINCCDLGILR